MNIFIDTNIYLSFYHFSSDDLDELKKLVILISKRKLKLILPSQVIQEFQRNRESKLEDALKRFNEQKLDFPFPQFCKDYPEFAELRELQKAYSKCHNALKEKVISDIQSKKLKADSLFEELIKYSTVIKTSDKLYMEAKKRMEMGNPPGKDGAIGDAINWEALLQNVPKNEDIYFISDDNDYASPIEKDSFNAFLSEEWLLTKSSKIFFYRRLSSFFKEYFPEILLEDEQEKDRLIQSLAGSRKYADTHLIISQLNKYSDFSATQVGAIISAYFNNNQISWIIDDPDVHDFIENIYKIHKDLIDPYSLEVVELILGISHLPPPPERPLEYGSDSDIPF
jgi:rRNA-processing protein FCF1